MTRLSWVRPRLGVWWLVALGLGAGLLLMWDGHVRGGGFTFAASLLLAGLLRLLLPPGIAGGLAVRSRTLDVLTLLGLGLAVAAVVAALDLTPR